jgi:TrmH RNA methyltransferase
MIKRRPGKPPAKALPQREETDARRPSRKETEMKYYGMHACLALFEHRPNEIIKIYVQEERVKVFSPLLKWCADKRRPYNLISEEELRKVSSSVHHEGICVVASPPPRLDFDSLKTGLAQTASSSICLLYLDGIGNPHNIGSIVRVAAHFGVPYILGDEQSLPRHSPSSVRIAQGGVEAVTMIALKDPARQLAELAKMDFKIMATSSHRGSKLFDYKFPKKSVLVLGAEVTGVSERLMKIASDLLQIPGSGQVQSLNVAVAAGLLMGEFYRTYGNYSSDGG